MYACVDRVSVGCEPPASKLGPDRGYSLRHQKKEMLELGEQRVEKLQKRAALNMVSANPQGVGGTHVMGVRCTMPISRSCTTVCRKDPQIDTSINLQERGR